MISKVPILNDRIRHIPKSFSWIDHLLVRDRHLDSLSHQGAVLYLFLVCVSDVKGLSYYGDQVVMERLTLSPEALETARNELVVEGLIAWRRPLYQVLQLQTVQKDTIPGNGKVMQLGDILKKAMGEAR